MIHLKIVYFLFSWSLHVYDKAVSTIFGGGTGGHVFVTPYFLVCCVIQGKSETWETESRVLDIDFNGFHLGVDLPCEIVHKSPCVLFAR